MFGSNFKEKWLMHLGMSIYDAFISLVVLFTGLRPHFCAVLLGAQYSRRKHCVPIIRDIKFFFSYILVNVGVGLIVCPHNIIKLSRSV